MEIITALVLQTWFDISIQKTGSTKNAFAIALANHHSITDIITEGQQIIIPKELEVFKRTVSFLEGKNVIPATGATKNDLDVLTPTLGIGTMTIGTTFIVT